jgi:hypothetical protein
MTFTKTRSELGTYLTWLVFTYGALALDASIQTTATERVVITALQRLRTGDTAGALACTEPGVGGTVPAACAVELHAGHNKERVVAKHRQPACDDAVWMQTRAADGSTVLRLSV